MHGCYVVLCCVGVCVMFCVMFSCVDAKMHGCVRMRLDGCVTRAVGWAGGSSVDCMRGCLDDYVCTWVHLTYTHTHTHTHTRAM